MIPTCLQTPGRPRHMKILMYAATCKIINLLYCFADTHASIISSACALRGQSSLMISQDVRMISQHLRNETTAGTLARLNGNMQKNSACTVAGLNGLKHSPDRKVCGRSLSTAACGIASSCAVKFLGKQLHVESVMCVINFFEKSKTSVQVCCKTWHCASAL